MANEIITLKGEILNKLARVDKEFSIAANCQNTLRTMSDTLDDLGVGGSLGAPVAPVAPPVGSPWTLAMDVRDYFTDAASYAKGTLTDFPRFYLTREKSSGSWQSYLGLTTQYSYTSLGNFAAASPAVYLLQKSEVSQGEVVGQFGEFMVHLLTHQEGHPVVQFQIYNWPAGDLFLSSKNPTGSTKILQEMMSMTPDRTDANTKFILSGTFGRCKIHVWQPSVAPSTQFTQKAVRPDGLLNPRSSGTPHVVRAVGSASDSVPVLELQNWSLEYLAGNRNHPYPLIL